MTENSQRATLPPINLDMAQSFLNALDPEAEIFTFQTFDDSKAKRRELAHIFNGTLQEFSAELETRNKAGAGIFVTINETDGTGRTIANITRIRAVFQEDDGDGKQLPIDPHIIVQSSEGKFHRYVLVDGPSHEDVDSLDEEFKPIQARMVTDYGSDPAAKDLARVMRLPGFYHFKDPKKPQQVSVIHMSGDIPLPWEQATKVFPPASAPKPEAVEEVDKETGEIYVGEARNSYVHKLTAKYSASMTRMGLGLEAIKAAILAQNNALCRPPLTIEELNATIFKSLERRYYPRDKERAHGEQVELECLEAEMGVEEAALEAAVEVDEARAGNPAVPISDLAAMGEVEYVAIRKQRAKEEGMDVRFLDAMRSRLMREAKVVEKAKGAAAERKKKERRKELRIDDSELSSSFARRHDGLRYIDQWGRWLNWTGSYWRSDQTCNTKELVRVHLERTREKVKEVLEPSELKSLCSHPTVTHVEHLARGRPKYQTLVDDLDQYPELLNTPAGIINLVRGTMRGHRMDDLITMQTTVAPDRKAGCPHWTRFLDTITGNRPELVSYLQRLMGYCLTGSVEEQVFAFFYGSGANGKGTFLNTMQRILGPYSGTARSEVFTEGKFEQHPTDIAGFFGKRLIVSQETEGGRRWAESRMKSLTGGDIVSARFMRQDNFDFAPCFKLVLAGNHKPSLRHVDEAMRRRLRLVPFTVTIPKNRRDRRLQAKLMVEAPSILAWAIDGARAYYESGLDDPRAVMEATSGYFDDEDSIQAFLQEKCSIETGAWEYKKWMYKTWQEFCESRGESPGTDKAFTQRMRNAGFEDKASNGKPLRDMNGMKWAGLKLLELPGHDAYRKGS